MARAVEQERRKEFEEGVAAGKGVVELIGNDVAAFCGDLAKSARTDADVYQEAHQRESRLTPSGD